MNESQDFLNFLEEWEASTKCTEWCTEQFNHAISEFQYDRIILAVVALCVLVFKRFIANYSKTLAIQFETSEDNIYKFIDLMDLLGILILAGFFINSNRISNPL